MVTSIFQTSDVGCEDCTSFPDFGRALRDALGRAPTSVCVATTIDEADQHVGVTIGSFASLSLDPPLISWTLMERSSSTSRFRHGELFGISVLAAEQAAISAAFTRRDTDRFEGIDFVTCDQGLRYIRNAAAWFRCRLSAILEGGDHKIFVGEVLSLRAFDHEPLLHWRGKYMTVQNIDTGEVV